MKLIETRLMVERFDQTFDFYAQTLELPVTWGKKGDVYASFQASAESQLSIFNADLMDEHLGLSDIHRVAVLDKTMLAFSVEDTDKLYEKFAASGINCLNEPHDMPGWGIRCFHLRDPEGNLVEIHQELPREAWSADLQEDAEKYQ